MKRSTYTILLLMLAGFSFLSGFTYQDIGHASGLPSAIATLKEVPGRLVAAVKTELMPDKADLQVTDTYLDVYTYISSKYYGEKSPQVKELTYAAISGMLASLGDRYTRFLDPENNKRMQQDNRGDFEGIGAKLDIRDGRVYIDKPIDDSPAQGVGLKPLDEIVKVNDVLIQTLDTDPLKRLQEVVNNIRGPRGTKVHLTIKREGVAEPLEFDITRDVINSPMVEFKMADDVSKIGYVLLEQFNEKSDEQLDRALTKLEEQNIRGLILDLRNNPGGLLDVARDIGSRFIKDGDIVIIQNKGGDRTPLTVNSDMHTHRMYPLVVLVNNMSASASEIVAGAIQDHKAGTIVGTDTFGKGLVQQILNLPDQSAVAITTAKYLTPSLRDVNKTKIHPDVVVEPSPEDIKAKNDVQLKRAVQILKERLGDMQAKSQDTVRQ